jgi:phage tail sheath protein FI
MPDYVAPGVYVEEIEPGPRPIEGVPTSTAAFIGLTERGPVRPRLVTSYGEYVRWFGDVFAPKQYMPHAVAGFFENGGARLYVSRIIAAGSTTATGVFGDFTARAAGPGRWGNQVWLRVLRSQTIDARGNPAGFCLRLAYWSEPGPPNFDPFEPANRNRRPRPQFTEEYDDLSVDPASSNYFPRRLNDAATSQPVSSLASFSLTAEGSAVGVPVPTAGEFLASGRDGTLPIRVTDFVGEIDRAIGRLEPQGISALELVPFHDVALVYAPFPADDELHAIVKRLVAHCEEQRFRFAVIDGPNTDPMDLHPRNPQTGITETQYAAFYAPWIVIADPLTGARITVPPGGHIAGIYARVDAEQGVFKAPADEVVRGALDVAFEVKDAAQAELHSRGVNAIRALPGRGIRIWGAGTLSSNGLWKYVPVRRLFIFLERSIYEGTEWVVFEPNDDRLWDRVKDTIRLFLRSQWRSGVLSGRTEDEAFFVTCDRTTMGADDILNGRLICEIGIAAVRPAEFVVLRLLRYTAESRR